MFLRLDYGVALRAWERQACQDPTTGQEGVGTQPTGQWQGRDAGLGVLRA
ncbi:hypothetical protein [Actinomyces trachealis]|nr:hypothetical protein [Actinomyces trachealis]